MNTILKVNGGLFVTFSVSKRSFEQANALQIDPIPAQNSCDQKRRRKAANWRKHRQNTRNFYLCYKANFKPIGRKYTDKWGGIVPCNLTIFLNKETFAAN
jgi:hypothetical protein